MAKGKRGRRKKQEEPEFSLSPETKRGILVVFLFAVTAVLALALFGLAGPLGRLLDGLLASFLGQTRAIFIVAVALGGLQVLFPEKRLLRGSSYLGFLLFFLSANGLIHAWEIGAEAGLPLEVAGGALGLLVYQMLFFIVGEIASYIVLAALLVASALVLFQISLVKIAAGFQNLFSVFETAPQPKAKPRIMDGEEEIECEGEECEEENQESGIKNQEDDEEEPEQDAPVTVTKVESGIMNEELGEDEAVQPLISTKGAALVRPKRRRSISIPLDLLDGTPSKPTSGDIEANMDIIQRTLKNFGIEVEMGDVNVGPTVTQYSFKPAEGVKLTKITSLKNDLALALAAHPIRMEAPIPGKSLVGVEVPNKAVATVRLKDILGAKVFTGAASPLTFGLGKDVSGKPWVAEIEKMPHLLVAGQTGSGKSVCLNTILLSLMYKTGPDDLKFILVDPKRVELSSYNGIPYLLTPVITDVQKTVNALKWAVAEMDRRYERLQAFGARDIKSYNEKAEDGMPYLVIVIDELADLMATSAQDVESSIVRLAQMARAVGIHLVLATQRPSVNVITGLIKANIPGRIAFAVASNIDSRTILDAQGAETLLGRGDMLLSTAEMNTPKRIQGAFVGEEEIRRVCTFLKNTCEAPEYDVGVVERQRSGTVFSGGSDADAFDGDPLLEDAVRVVSQAGKASASLLQRRLKVGYARAARLLDILEERGVIGPGDGAKPRDILMKGGAPALEAVPAVEENRVE